MPPGHMGDYLSILTLPWQRAFVDPVCVKFGLYQYDIKKINWCLMKIHHCSRYLILKFLQYPISFFCEVAPPLGSSLFLPLTLSYSQFPLDLLPTLSVSQEAVQPLGTTGRCERERRIWFELFLQARFIHMMYSSGIQNWTRQLEHWGWC